MAASCPLFSTQAWKDLEAAVGFGNAMTAHALNNHEIPDVAQALVLLKQHPVMDADERHVRNSESFKLERVIAQGRDVLLPYLNADLTTPAQARALQGLLDNNAKYQGILADNVSRFDLGQPVEKTTSVTSFIGSSDYVGKTSTYEGFKFFGTYVHQLLEDLQQESNRTRKTPAELLTRDFFDTHRAKMKPGERFDIAGLDEDTLFAMAGGLAAVLQKDAKTRSIILPEITLLGTNKFGQHVVGRLDLMVIDPDGNVRVLDFKTKKIAGLVTPSGTIDTDAARMNLASTSWKIDKDDAGTAANFLGQNRTAYDTWTLQTHVYQNMLQQAGLSVSGTEIIALMYQADDNKTFQGYAIEVFSGNNYYTSAGKGAKTSFGKPLTEDATTRKVDDLRKKVNEMLPVSEAQAEESRESLLRQYAFDLSKPEELALIKTVEELVASELDKTRAAMRLYKTTKPALFTLYETRLSTLIGFQRSLTTGSDTLSSMKMRFTTEALETEFKAMLGLSKTAMEAYRTQSGREKIASGEIMRSAYAKVTELSPLFDLVDGLVTAAEGNAEVPGITSNSEIVRLMGELKRSRTTITENFRVVGLQAHADNIQNQVGAQTFQHISAEMRLALEPQILHKQGEIDTLRAGGALSFSTRLGNAGALFLDKINKDILKRDLDAIGKSNLSKLEQLEKELVALQVQHDSGIVIDRADIERYVAAVTDSTSNDYIGQSDKWTQGFAKGYDGWQATIANSDRGLYAFVSLAKQAAAEATMNAQEHLQVREVDKTIRPLVTEKGEKGANESVTEWRTRAYTDENGEQQTSRQQYFNKPTSNDYDQVSWTYQADSRKLNLETRAAEAAIFSAPLDERAALTEAWLAKVAEEKALKQQHTEWQAQHQHRPMVDAFYELANRLPIEVQTEIMGLYHKIELLSKNSGGKNNEELFSPEDQELIRLYEIDIKKLRRDARTEEDKETMELLNSFFTFAPNYVAYNRWKQAKEREYVDNPEKLAAWHAENTVYAPTPAWHEERGALIERMGEIIGRSDTTFQDLLKERSRILAPYRRDGEFDPTYLTAEDAELLTKAEFAITLYQKADKQSELVLDEDAKAELKLLSSELKSLTTSEINPYYQRNLDEKSESLIQKRFALLQTMADSAKAKTSGNPSAQAEADLLQAEAATAFYLEQQDFESWYNQNHKQPFQPKNKKITFFSTGLDPRNGAKPKDFNFDKLPPKELREQYMEHRPRGKWNTRQVNDIAKNPEYEQHFQLPDGTALPKSLRLDNGIVSVIPGTDTQYVNPKYQAMLADPTALAFYNALMPYYFERQASSTGRKPGYLVPAGEGNLVQEAANLEDGIVGALKNRTRNQLDETFSGKESLNDQLTNFYGDQGNRIRLRGVDQLPEHLQGGDAINNLIKFCAETHYNEAMAEAQPQLDSMIDYWELQLKDIQAKTTSSAPGYKQRAEELSGLIKLARFERDKFLTGKMSDGSNRNVRKILGKLSGATAFARIAFDMANQTKNYVSGSLQAFMAAGHGDSAHYQREDLAWAVRQQFGLDGFFGDYLKDWGKLSGLSLNTQLYRAYNPGQHDFQAYLEDTTGTKNRQLAAKLTNLTELAHAVQEKGDTAISQMVWLAVMNHHQYQVLDAQGQPVVSGTREDGRPIYQTVKAHQAYALDAQNRLVIRHDVAFTKDDERHLREKVHSEVRKAQGNYASQDKTERESTIIGQIMNFFRKYLIPNVLTRLGHLRPNWEGQELHYGYLRATGAALKYYGLGETMKHLVLGAYTPNWVKGSKMNSFYAGKVGHAGRDLISATVLSVISMMLMAYVKGRDDDEDIGFFAGNLIRVVWGVKQETVSMNPFPIVGGADDYIKNFTSFTTMTNELTKVPKVLTHLLGASYANLVGGWGEESEDDSELYKLALQQGYYQRSEGPYEAGDFKLAKDFADFSGYKNMRNFFHPQYGIDIAKKYQ